MFNLCISLLLSHMQPHRTQLSCVVVYFPSGETDEERIPKFLETKIHEVTTTIEKYVVYEIWQKYDTLKINCSKCIQARVKRVRIQNIKTNINHGVKDTMF